jgi:hypothetical protein
MAMIS